MQQAILEKKGLRKEELEKQRAPILKMRQDAKRKKQKLQQTLLMQEELFEHSKNLFMLKRKPEAAKVSVQADAKRIETPVEEDILEQEVKVKATKGTSKFNDMIMLLCKLSFYRIFNRRIK